jgi:hypothetical protein
MYNWQLKVFSIVTILAMALALCPPVTVSAAPGDATIIGTITMPQDTNGATFRVNAYPTTGGDGNCDTAWVGDGDYALGAYNFELTNCDSSKNYTVTAQGAGYTFAPDTVASVEFTGSPLGATANILPIARVFSGVVTKPDGSPWSGFNVRYSLDGAATTSVATNGSGVYSIPGVNDVSSLYFPEQDIDGYDLPGDWTYSAPLQNDIVDNNFTSRGTRGIWGHIETWTDIQGCRTGVTMTIAAPGALTQTTVTDSDGAYSFNNLEPLSTYVITPSKIGAGGSACVFTPASQTIDITGGDGNHAYVFRVMDTGVYGKVKTTLGDSTLTDYASLAYYLIATYTTNDGAVYSNAVNWANGEYWISAPPSSGTVTITRVGGTAGFGYDTAPAAGTTGSSQTVTITNLWTEKNFVLQPNRVISGTIKGQNDAPVTRGTTVDFGYWLKWKQSTGTPLTAYSLKAQPKVYYLSPVESGIISSTPVRILANLTTAPAFTTANFLLNLKTYTLEGCLSRFESRDSLVLTPTLPPTVMRFRPAASFGTPTTTYPATLTLEANGCPAKSYYYKITSLPRGMVGTLEVDGHTVRGMTIDGINYDMWRSYSVYGSRTITGRIYSPNLDLSFNRDFHDGNGLLVLRDAATNQVVSTSGDIENSYEFNVPLLEAKTYTLSINQDQIPYGYTANPAPMSKIVTVNLSAGDVDIPAASGFVLTHLPMDPMTVNSGAIPGSYFTAAGTSQAVTWSPPPFMNDRDWDEFKGYDLQVGLATAAFSDLSPVPVFHADDGNNDYTFTGLTNGQFYRWRIRAVYENDKGPWIETGPMPTGPANYSYRSTIFDPEQVDFTWNDLPGTLDANVSTAVYVVQYSTSPTFAVATTLAPVGPAVGTVSTLVDPAAQTVYYWRVKAQRPAGVDISGWSPTQVFFNRFNDLTAGPDFIWDNFGVKFKVGSTIPVFPADSYYQVELDTNDLFPTPYVRTFPRTANFTTPSARVYLDDLPTGNYYWRIRVVVGNDHNAYPITDWTVGADSTPFGTTINIP